MYDMLRRLRRIPEFWGQSWLKQIEHFMTFDYDSLTVGILELCICFSQVTLSFALSLVA